MEGLEEVIESRLRLPFGACLLVIRKGTAASGKEERKEDFGDWDSAPK